MKYLLRSLLTLLLLLLCSTSMMAIGRVYARIPNWASSPIYNLRIKTLTAEVRIQDQMAVTHVDQEFANDQNQRLEGFYVFKLPTGAQVNELYLWINGLRVPYIVKKRQEAVQRYEEIVRGIQDPALLEQFGDNRFQLRIFPIDARSVRRIEIVYSQPLAYFSESLQYTFPLDMKDYTSAPIERVALKVSIQSQLALPALETSVDQFPASVVVTQKSPNAWDVVYGVENVSFSRDFHIRCTVNRDHRYMLALTYRDPSAPTEDPFYVLWSTAPDSLTGDLTKGRDMVFVADVSSSMEGDRLVQLKDALRSFVDLLTDKDHFNIITFSTGVVSFRSDLVAATPEEKNAARDFVSKIVAMGLTNIDAALTKALKQTWTSSTEASVLFVTDGQPSWGVTQPDSIINAATRLNTSQVSIYTVGLGEELDYSLLKNLATRNNGFFTAIESTDSMYVRFKELYRHFILPTLRNVTMEYGQLGAYDVHPDPLPVVSSGDQIISVGRFKKFGMHTLSLIGDVEGSPFSVVQDVMFSDTNTTDLMVARYWGAQKIASLLRLISQVGERKELVDQVVALSIKYSVLTPYTAFLVLEPTGSTNNIDPMAPASVHLDQNYPNPFNPTTTIRYTLDLPAPAMVRLEIHDMLGRLVRVLVQGVQDPGSHTIVWDGRNDAGELLPSGSYRMTLTTGDRVLTRSMLLLK